MEYYYNLDGFKNNLIRLEKILSGCEINGMDEEEKKLLIKVKSFTIEERKIIKNYVLMYLENSNYVKTANVNYYINRYNKQKKL